MKTYFLFLEDFSTFLLVSKLFEWWEFIQKYFLGYMWEFSMSLMPLTLKSTKTKLFNFQ